jgi:molybdopterin molybdotransferase
MDIAPGSHDYAGLVNEMHSLLWKAPPVRALIEAVQQDEKAQAVPVNPRSARRFGALAPVRLAEQRLLASLRPVGACSASIGNALGRVLAEPLRCEAPVPAKAVALREGFAVSADAVVGASAYSPILVAQQPEWVETGDVMPAGCDAVLPPDAVSLDQGVVAIGAAAVPGEGLRRAGEDVAHGKILRAAGERLRQTDIAVARGIGVERVVIRTARVRIISLIEGHADMTGSLVGACAEARGAAVERIALRSRDVGSIGAALRQEGADLIVVVGGTGLGHDDHAAEALAQAGALIAHGLALRPGETSGCGVVDTTPVILVPGRPEAALAAALLLVRPCLDHLMTASPERSCVSGRLTRKISSTIGMTELVMVRVNGHDLEPIAVADVTLAAIAQADAWLTVAPESEGCAAGETATAFVL